LQSFQKCAIIVVVLEKDHILLLCLEPGV
jgi:hypothetical protein